MRTIRIENVQKKDFETIFDITFLNKTFKNIKINLIGNHNVLNAAAVFGLCHQLGINEAIIRKTFESFVNSKRRLEKVLSVNETIFFDDYAHHPTEVKCTLKALKDAIHERKLICIFQPHRYSRLNDLFDEFINSFDLVDELIVTNIYSAGEKKIKNVSEKKLVEKLKEKDINVKHIKDEKLEDYILKNVGPFDVVIALGAGDISSKIRNIANNFSKNPKKLKVGIIYGGKSNEHEISIKSTKNYSLAFDEKIFEVNFFKILKDGRWIYQGKDITNNEDESKSSNDKFSSKILKELKKIDVAFPILHGPFGEDGMLGAFLDTLEIPYIGSDYFTASIGMDKAFSKFVVRSYGVLTTDFIEVLERDWRDNKENIIAKILNQFSFPVYIKPNHLGSSIGIKYIEDRKDLKEAIDYVFKFDTSLIIEERVLGEEVQAAVIGNDNIIVGEIGQFLSENQFFDYEKKYEKCTMVAKLPLDLPKEKIDEIKNAARQIYKALKLNGFSRIDFFLGKDQKLYFNEVNPIPGYSSALSLFPRMLAHIGISPKDMINNFVTYAFHKARKNKIFERQKV